MDILQLLSYLGIFVFAVTGVLKAKLVTAYEKNDIDNILQAPDFEKSEEFFRKE